VDFNFYEGEIVSIVGESGSGKTTLAKMLLGLISSTEGEIYFQGKKRDISSQKKKQEYWKNIQAIFQDPFSSYNIFRKIDAVLLDCIHMRGGRNLPHAKKVELMTEACSFVNLKFEELTNKYPFELSGGQMQRVAIARSLAVDPPIILADEPTGNLDSKTGYYILGFLNDLHKKDNKTIIIVTHDVEIVKLASRVVHLKDGQIENIELCTKDNPCELRE
jgi:peptide/nickel transport system ATP-binding protein